MLERGNLPWFEFKVGDNAGSYQIASPRLTVGRDASSDWVIPHPTVSRKHFELLFKDYVYSIVDLNSSNGLKVNGEKVKKIELRHGDIIHAGDLILTFHI
jgi:pSer/pThr/pTyr-binding forkhead associated (FHA) protein